MAFFVPENVKVPQEALKYIPAQHIVFFGKGKSAQRFIFRNQELTAFENEKLTRLEQMIEKEKINPFLLHPNWNRNDVLRFCYGTGWKTRVAKEALLKYLKWKQSIMPQGYLSLYPRVSKILETGCIYLHGRDMHYRPIMVINFNRFNIRRFSIEEYIHMIAFLLDFIIENMLLPGKVENWVVISDFERNGFGELGFSSLRQVMGILTDNYRCRLGCNYVVNPAKGVYYMWTCMKPFLDEVLIEKVKILNKPHPDELFLHCNPYQVEEKYGGRARNTSSFWPPIMPKAPYTLNESPQASIDLPEPKSFESEMNPVEESQCSPKRRSLSISGAFEVVVHHDSNSYHDDREQSRIEEEQKEAEEKERKRKEKKRKRREKRKREKLDKKMRNVESDEIENNKNAEIDTEQFLEEVIKESPKEALLNENECEPEIYSPTGNLIDGSEGLTFESTRTDIRCGISSIKTCSLF